MSNKTISKRRSVLNLIFRYAIGVGDASTNPVHDIIVPQGKEKQEKRAMTDDEIKIVIQNMNNGFWGFWAFFTIMTGCRCGETFALTYGDVDEQMMTLRVHRTVEHQGNVGIIKNHTKTDAGMRTLPITDEILQILDVKHHKKSELIFPDPLGGGVITKYHLYSEWEKYRESVGLPEDLTPHMVRHTYATILYDADVDVKSMQYLMGHKDASTSMKIYVHLSERRKKKSEDKTRQKMKDFFEEI